MQIFCVQNAKVCVKTEKFSKLYENGFCINDYCSSDYHHVHLIQ